MTQFVRVRLDNGSEASVSAEFAELHKLKPLDKEAARHGVALDPKFNPLKRQKPPAAADTTQKEK